MVTEIACPQNQHPSCLPLLIRQLDFLLLIHIHHLAGERVSFFSDKSRPPSLNSEAINT